MGVGARSINYGFRHKVTGVKYRASIVSAVVRSCIIQIPRGPSALCRQHLLSILLCPSPRLWDLP